MEEFALNQMFVDAKQDGQDTIVQHVSIVRIQFSTMHKYNYSIHMHIHSIYMHSCVLNIYIATYA